MADFYALTYLSRATQPFPPEALLALAEQAAAKNAPLNITGYLCYVNGDFFQFLEGSEAAVTALMDAIAADDRHEVLSVVRLGTTDQQLFPHWSMRHINPAEMATIELEHVLHSVLSGMQSRVFGEARLAEMVRSLAGRISAQRHHLTPA